MSVKSRGEDEIGVPSVHMETSSAVSATEVKFDIFVLLTVLLGGTKFLTAWTLVATFAGLGLALILRPDYTASATIMPPQAPQSSLSTLLGQLGPLSAVSGGAASLLKNPGDLYVGILQSRTISDGAIEHFQLKPRWKEKSMVATRKYLESHAQFEAAKNGLIQISVTDHDPRFASDLANYFVDALYNVNSTLAMSEAAHRRLFFERQLNDEKAALFEAEENLKNTQLKTGLITVSGQTELAVRNIAATRAEISARQVQLQGLRSYASEENPDVGRLKVEIQTLQGQLSKLEEGQSHQVPGDTEISTSQLPAGGLEYARELREVKYHDTLLELLSRQYEAARIDEAKSAPQIQIVDRAVPPDQKSGPSRALIILGFAFGGLFLGCIYLLSRELLRQAKLRPETGLRLAELRFHTSRRPL